MLIGTIGCIVCIAFYVITIVVGFFLNKKLFDNDIESVKSGKTAGEVANIILEKYFGTDEIAENNEEIDDEELNDEVAIDEEKPRFGFDATEEHTENNDEITKINMPTYQNVTRLDDKLHTYSIDFEENKVVLSSDIYDSTSLDAIGIATYQAMSLLSHYDEDKPAKFSFISFVTAIPKLILQIGWLVAVLPFLGVVNLSIGTVITLNIIVIVSFLLNLLNIFYPKYIAERAIDELIEEKIIDESEVETVFETTNVLANKTATSCFGFLRWFLRKFMGYDV